MARNVLVLTATGTVGSATVHALVRRGATVHAGTRDPGKASVAAGATAVAWSYDDRATWAPALAGIEALFLAIPPFRSDEAEVGAAIIEAAKAAGVRRIVKLSAAGVENNPESGHRRIELALEASGLEWLHLRPTFFAENFIEAYGAGIKHDGAIYLPAGKGKAGFITAADIGEVAAVALLGDTSGEAWPLTGSESLDHDEVAEIFTRELGRPIRYVDISPQVFEDSLRKSGADDNTVAGLSGLFEFVRAGWTGGTTGEVERVLGRPPQPLAVWVREHARAWS